MIGNGHHAQQARTFLRRGQVLACSLDRSEGDYFAYLPRRVDPGAPLLVSVHGISLNAREHVELFAPNAEARGVVVVAPVFARGRFRAFQRLSRGRPRPDRFFDRVVRDVRARTGCNGAGVALFGFSGGGQFAHRYALIHPERVRSLIIAASGWYTFPDNDAPYPWGLAPNERYPHVRCRLPEFLRIRTRVVVGEHDTERDPSLNTDPDVDRQGQTRLERAIRWVEAVRRAAHEHSQTPAVSLVTLPGVKHSFSESVVVGGLAEIVFEALY